MAVLIIILLIFFLPMIIKFIMGATLAGQVEKSREIIYSDNRLINYYSKRVILTEEEKYTIRFNLYADSYVTENNYKENIRKLTNAIYESDRIGDKKAVNDLAKFLVIYYTEPIIRYGNNSEKKMLRNMAMLLSANGFIDNSEEY
ncbi:MAG: hypothetical protein IKJ50_01720 [Clostridia bacterium]|nr:hypothetical protein [Clostridia bacterium]